MSSVVEPHATSKFEGGHLVLASYCSVAPSPSVACSKVVARASMAWLFHWLPCYPSLPLLHPSPFSSMCVEYGRAADGSGVMSVAWRGPVPRTVAPTSGRGRASVRPSVHPASRDRTLSPSVWLLCDQRSDGRPVVVSRQPHSVAFRWPASKSPSLYATV